MRGETRDCTRENRSERVTGGRMSRSNTSVAMATCNGGSFIADPLARLAAQSRRPDPRVIYDDASQDDTLETIEVFRAQALFEIRTEKNSQRPGVTAHFEKGISLCDGDIILLADEDDVWHPENLKHGSKASNIIPSGEWPSVMEAWWIPSSFLSARSSGYGGDQTTGSRLIQTFVNRQRRCQIARFLRFEMMYGGKDATRIEFRNVVVPGVGHAQFVPLELAPKQVAPHREQTPWLSHAGDHEIRSHSRLRRFFLRRPGMKTADHVTAEIEHEGLHLVVGRQGQSRGIRPPRRDEEHTGIHRSFHRVPNFGHASAQFRRPDPQQGQQDRRHRKHGDPLGPPSYESRLHPADAPSHDFEIESQYQGQNGPQRNEVAFKENRVRRPHHSIHETKPIEGRACIQERLGRGCLG